MSTAAAAFTYEFIRKALPKAARRVLEVGCGEGELAALLQQDGIEVIAIDSDPECVAAAKGRGVDARMSAWPDFQDGTFDAILFTRSLHHMHDLDRSVEAAFAMLLPGGRVIVEDFDVAFDHEPSLAWFREYSLTSVEDGPAPDPESFVAKLLASNDPREAWVSSHEGHLLHSAAAIEAALRRFDPQFDRREAACFFRYVGAAFADASRAAEKALHDETRLIADGRIEPLGRRYIASI